MADESRAAIVVGLCAHGLDLVRALALNGVRVHAIESKSNLPGVDTGLAHVHLVREISGPGLIPAVSAVAGLERLPPVLLLTNDRMVFEVAARWDLLADSVRLSWEPCRQQAAKFLHKENLPELCSRANLRYPRSVILDSSALEDSIEAIAALAFPLLVKPVRPMSSFKAVLISNREEFLGHLGRYQQDLPFVVQEWISGDVTSLMFCALYLDKGRPLVHFEGRKLDTLPRGLGTTTAAERIDAPKLYESTLRFFDGYGITGPVSLEFKADPAGDLWVIEPTVFRTDYWAGCCIANGINLPLVEYRRMAGMGDLHELIRPARVWVDLERNPASLVPAVLANPQLLLRPWRLSLTYLSADDPKPFFRLLLRWSRRLFSSLAGRSQHALRVLLGPRRDTKRQ